MPIFGVFLNFSLILIFDRLRWINTVNVGLHSGEAFILHPLQYMTLDIQSKGGGGVAEIALHRLDIIPGTDSGHGVRVA